MTAPTDRSYRALLAVPGLGRILLASQLARIAQAMVGVALVLFTLATYRSPALAGVVTFTATFPGLLASPIAGALLDRHGRVRLVVLDYLVALASLALIGGLSLAGALPPPLLLAIAAVSSMTAVLSQTGLRSLYPLIVPPHLWERVNAVDSNGYLIATILGPPIAASLVAIVGGPVALIGIGTLYALAVVAMLGFRDPPSQVATTGRLLLDAWQGLVYTWRNRTLRGLGFSISTLNFFGGVQSIVIPLIVLDRLHGGEAAVGLVFAVSGIAGMVSAFAVGRIDTRGREWRLLVVPMFATALAVALLIPASGALSADERIDPAIGFAILGLSLAIGGLVGGPMDVAMFTMRQRRTDPAWTGRAFAISMAFNFLGFPIGAAAGGVLASISLTAAIVAAVVACVLSGILAATLVPRADDPVRDAASSDDPRRDEPRRDESHHDARPAVRAVEDGG